MRNNFLTLNFHVLLVIVGFYISCNSEEMDELDSNYCTILYPPLDTLISTHTDFTKSHYPKRIASFMSDSLHTGDIVMLGNSLTELGGNWATRLGRSNVKNRGIAGDNTYGVMARINEVICSEPSLVFLMIGTNDIFLNDTPEKIASNIQLLAKSIKESESTTVYVETIMPVSFGHEKTQKIHQVNELLRSSISNDYILIDTFEEMSDDRGALAGIYTTDGIHLTQSAYQKWSEFLKQFLISE